METSLAHLNEEAVKRFASLEDISKKLIGKEYSDFLMSSEAVGMVIDNEIFMIMLRLNNNFTNRPPWK